MANNFTSQEIILVLQKQKFLLREKFHVKEIGLFGSFARGEATQESVIDFLVVIDTPLEIYRQTKEALNDYLRNIFGREVDLANPNSLKPHYKERILQQAVYA